MGGRGHLGDDGKTTTTFEFEPIDDGARTLVTITESAWQATPEGAKHAFGNCEGWTGMLAAMKVVGRARHQPARRLLRVAARPSRRRAVPAAPLEGPLRTPRSRTTCA